jgi:hypothetical protein
MANEIKDKYTSSAAFTVTVASLASSTVSLGNSSDMVDNTGSRYQRIKVYAQVKLGSSPGGNTSVYLYALRGDKNGYRTDGVPASASGSVSFLNAPLLGVMRTKSSPSTGDVLYGDFEMVSPGPEFGVGISHDTGVAFDSTAGNHFVRWVGVDPEVQ